MTTKEYTLEVTSSRLLIVRPDNSVLFVVKVEDEEYAREILANLNASLVAVAA